MASEVNLYRPNIHKVEESFIDKHFTKIAFAVSTFAMLIFSPLILFLGSAIGIAINYYINPDLKLKATDSIVTVPNAVFAIVGATGSLLKLTPAGVMGGFVFQMTPLLGAVGIGMTSYRASKLVYPS